MGHDSTGVASQILTFEVADRRLAIPVADVAEVVRAVAVTPLPGAPDVVAGIVDVRGSIIPVLDLRSRLGLSTRSVAPTDHFILIRGLEPGLAVWVDRVESLVDLPEDGVESLPELVPQADYVAGIVRLPDGLVLIQDVLRFLTPTEETELQDALRQLVSGTDSR